jgi:hypothetical protein
MTPHRARTALALLALVGFTACSDDGAPTVEEISTGAADNEYFASLCAVLDDVGAGDLQAANAGFDHGPLHELADQVTDIDRGVAADLLQAKEAVESALADDTTDPAEAAVLVAELTDATLAAYAAAGQPVPEPCTEENP